MKLLAVGQPGRARGGARAASATSRPIHLLDPATGAYNEPFLDAGLRARCGATGACRGS